jgi:hypothetical protein
VARLPVGVTYPPPPPVSVRRWVVHLEHHHNLHARVPRHLCTAHPRVPCGVVTGAPRDAVDRDGHSATRVAQLDICARTSPSGAVVTCCFSSAIECEGEVGDATHHSGTDVTTAPRASLSAPDHSRSLAVSSSSSLRALLSRADAVLETLHAIEPATHRFNLMVIVAGPGMFSPSVAVAGVASLLCLNLWRWALDHRFGSTAN